MLATLTHDYFSDPGWVFERKLDGERCLAFRKGKDVRLLSRNRKELNSTYPELVEALRDQEADDFVVDGEIVAFEGNRTSFSRLQQRMQVRDSKEALKTGVAVYYYLFDLLYLDRYDTTRLGQKGDPWEGMRWHARSLSEPRRRLEAMISDERS
jgi:bifunctional non-homologous end joining protein LigD